MATRCQLMILGRSSFELDNVGKYDMSVAMYRYYDGGPTEMLEVILKSIQKAEEKVVSGALFRRDGIRFLAVPVMKAIIEGEGASSRELVFEDIGVMKSSPRAAHVHGPSHLEWGYVIDCEKRMFNAYSIRKLGNESQCSGTMTDHLLSGPIGDAMSWEVALKLFDTPEDDRSPDITNVHALMDQLRSTGWSICDEEDAYCQLVKRLHAKQERHSLIAASQPGSSAYCI